jgi:DNA recombination protein RmuC
VELIVAVVVGIAVGGLLVWFAQEVRAKGRIATLSADHRETVAGLQGQLDQTKTGEALLETAKEQLRESFEATASRVAANNSEHFLQMANVRFDKSMETAKGQLDQHRQQFEAQVKQLSEYYEKLNPNIESLMTRANELTTETGKLANALTSSAQIGSWGEVELERVVELAGLTEHIDYKRQATVEGSGERPDMIVEMPEGRSVVIDSKASIKAYLEAAEAENETEVKDALGRHARALRNHVDDLAKKHYGDKADRSLDFVVMFVPGDQFISAALKANPELVTYAMAKRVVIATPASLISLLWAIAHGWRLQGLEQHANDIAKAGDDLFNRLKTFINHYDSVGKGLERALKGYDASIGSFDRSVIPKGREFAGLIGKGEEAFPTPYTIDAPQVRSSRYVEDEPLSLPEPDGDDTERAA